MVCYVAVQEQMRVALDVKQRQEKEARHRQLVARNTKYRKGVDEAGSKGREVKSLDDDVEDARLALAKERVAKSRESRNKRIEENQALRNQIDSLGPAPFMKTFQQNVMAFQPRRTLSSSQLN